MNPRLLVASAVTLLLLLGALLLAADQVVATGAVAGQSMSPGLLPGDRVLVDRWTYRQRGPRAGEIVLIADPSGAPIVKRVVRHSAGTLWVEGDNRGDSDDSRRFGGLSADRIRGRVVCRYWPPSRIGPVR